MLHQRIISIAEQSGTARGGMSGGTEFLIQARSWVDEMNDEGDPDWDTRIRYEWDASGEQTIDVDHIADYYEDGKLDIFDIMQGGECQHLVPVTEAFLRVYFDHITEEQLNQLLAPMR